MRTNLSAPVALFLFAHQDDEFGVFARLERERQAGRRVFCVYVTDGAATADPDRRDAESRAVLQKLGVSAGNILFVGRQLGIGDGRLYEKVDVLINWLDAFLDAQLGFEAYFVPAWEGGHPDHDLLHAIVVRLLAARGRQERVWQFPLYHGRGYPGPLFRVLSPLLENGPVERQAIPWRDRLRYMRLCLAYPSQWRTWIGLFPFVCMQYLFGGVQSLQRVDVRRITQPPHSGRLYYERRAFLDWPMLKDSLNQLPLKTQKAFEGESHCDSSI